MPVAISCVTVPVENLQKSIAFYRDGLGLTIEEQDEDHAALDLDGVYLVLLQREEFGSYAETVGARAATRGTVEAIISYFTESKGEVDAVMAQAQRLEHRSSPRRTKRASIRDTLPIRTVTLGKCCSTANKAKTFDNERERRP